MKISAYLTINIWFIFTKYCDSPLSLPQSVLIYYAKTYLSYKNISYSRKKGKKCMYFIHITYLVFRFAYRISEIWKKVQAKILKESLVLLIQTVPQQKALDLSFNLTPWTWCGITMGLSRPPALREVKNPPRPPTYTFHGKEAWRPLDNATPTFRVSN